MGTEFHREYKYFLLPLAQSRLLNLTEKPVAGCCSSCEGSSKTFSLTGPEPEPGAANILECRFRGQKAIPLDKTHHVQRRTFKGKDEIHIFPSPFRSTNAID